MQKYVYHVISEILLVFLILQHRESCNIDLSEISTLNIFYLKKKEKTLRDICWYFEVHLYDSAKGPRALVCEWQSLNVWFLSYISYRITTKLKF